MPVDDPIESEITCKERANVTVKPAPKFAIELRRQSR